MLHEEMPVHVLIYGVEKMVWRKKKKSRIRYLKMDNHIRFMGIRKIDEIPNTLVKELLRVKNLVDDRFDANVLRFYDILKEWNAL